jgi:hypothetical protein
MKVKSQPTKVNRAQLMNKLQEIVAANTADPAMELQTLGKALMEMGQALEGVSPADARAALLAVQQLN